MNKNDNSPGDTRPILLPVDPDCFMFVIPITVVGILAWVWALAWLWIPCALLAVCILAFFRDPARLIPYEPGAMVSPASGKVDEVSENKDKAWGPVPGTRVSIFLSVLDCHINRSPCEAEVLETRHEKGLFLNAMNPDSGHRNECNWIFLRRTDGREFTVRQVAGLIARRIVCRVSKGDKLGHGERFGLIRFGSRTDLVLPSDADVRVKPGDRVVGGATLIAVLPEKKGR